MPATPLAALADYHTHTPLCRHAEGWPGEYARVAVERGLGELGFADHNPMPQYFDDWRMLREDLPQYFDEVASARAKFPQLNIKLGLECDFIPGQEAWIEELAGMAEWDYLIGSVHYLRKGWEVDHPKYVGRHEAHAEEIWSDYWDLLRDVHPERALRFRRASGSAEKIRHHSKGRPAEILRAGRRGTRRDGHGV